MYDDLNFFVNDFCYAELFLIFGPDPFYALNKVVFEKHKCERPRKIL